jgi:hypothetical protein
MNECFPEKLSVHCGTFQNTPQKLQSNLHHYNLFLYDHFVSILFVLGFQVVSLFILSEAVKDLL